MPDCPATMPRGPGTTPLSRTRFPAAHGPTPAPAATTHHVSPTTEPCSASHLTVHEITLNKYCYCWSAVVVIPSNPAVLPQVFRDSMLLVTPVGV